MQLQLDSELPGARQAISEDEGLMRKAVKALKKTGAQKHAIHQTEHFMAAHVRAETTPQGQEDIKNGKERVETLEEIGKKVFSTRTTKIS